MARPKRLSEIKRQLMRRLSVEGSTTSAVVVAELREFALTQRFFSGYSIAQIITHHDLAQAIQAEEMERIIRRNSKRR